jgi:arabinose-5-phosphate isomerase
MSQGAKTIDPDALAAEAVQRMESDGISALVVTNKAGTVTGVIHLLALLRAGIV